MLKEERACREEAERQVRELKMKATTTTTATPGRGRKRKKASGAKGEEDEEELQNTFGDPRQGKSQMSSRSRSMKVADAQDHPLGLFEHLLQHSARSSGGSHTSMDGGARYLSPPISQSGHKRRPGVSDFARDFWLCE